MGPIGPMEIAVILLVCVLIFGPRQLPKLGRSLGQTIREFRNVGKQVAADFDEDESKST